MARVLDVLALILFALAVGVLVLGVYVMGNKDDVAAMVCFAAGIVLLRSAVDLLRPRSAS
ncbi:MAG: hypothetical protein MUF54_07065 [Polyangiaceae bacterium]|jgi:hypothetical protein|nr:hypothetical protein [Polyangiaceae bacterium]